MSLMVIDPIAGDTDETKRATPETRASTKPELKRKPLPAHPLAGMFPITSENEMKTLAEDIRIYGLLEPIDVFQGQVLDGRRRQFCCLKAGVQPKYRDYTGDDPASYVISKNLHRRHLNQSQMAVTAFKLLAHYEQAAKERQLAGKGVDGSGGRGNKKGGNLVTELPQGIATARVEASTPPSTKGGDPTSEPEAGANSTGRSRDQVAKLLGVSATYVQQIKLIAQKAPDQLKAIEQGKTTISKAMKKVCPSSGKRQQAKHDDKGSLIAREMLQMVGPLNGQKFDIVYLARHDLAGRDHIKRGSELLTNMVLADNALLIMRSGLNETVPPSIGRAGLMTALVLETGTVIPSELFNLDVRHELLLVYTTQGCMMAPPLRIESLVTCGDPQELIDSWFPTATKLRLVSDEKRHGWTTLMPIQTDNEAEPVKEPKSSKTAGAIESVQGKEELKS